LEFVTRKITNALARIKLNLQSHVILGNIEAERDWGYAPEYVEAMWLMLQQSEPNDFVIATGEKHSVKEFLDLACEYLNLNSNDVLSQNKKMLRSLEVEYLVGNTSKAKKLLKWEAKIKFKELVKIMVEADYERWQKHLKGEIFPWDAINDPNIYLNI